MANEVMRVKGNNGTLIIYDDHVYFERKSFLGNYDAATRGTASGLGSEKGVPLENINGVEYNKATMFRNGYISLFIEGEIKNMGGMKGAANDASSIIFFPGSNASAEAAYNHLLKIAQANKEKKQHVIVDNQQPSSGTASLADELLKLKQLHDNGILDDEEFKAAKSKLLNK